jgi:hypothetical protein
MAPRRSRGDDGRERRHLEVDVAEIPETLDADTGIIWRVAYVGNLICEDCGLTFTARWGSFEGADEYRCSNDHVVHVEPVSGTVLAVDGLPSDGRTLVALRGACPTCREELATGLLPGCPVCGGRDHQVLLDGLYG